eukprot:scaffold230576_cov42-Prasinocladus_malaysianus.AAC.1
MSKLLAASKKAKEVLSTNGEAHIHIAGLLSGYDFSSTAYSEVLLRALYPGHTGRLRGTCQGAAGQGHRPIEEAAEERPWRGCRGGGRRERQGAGGTVSPA